VDAIVMLKDDHKAVKALFRKLKGHDLSVVPKICEELTIHAEIEEQVFYPAIRPLVEELDVNEAYEEHHVVKLLIGELEAMSAEDENYEAKAVVLMEMVEHHVEEEEGELFPEVREAMSRSDLQDLGMQMEDLKAKLLSAAKRQSARV
jgi:hemerythrin superfamily protein